MAQTDPPFKGLSANFAALRLATAAAPLRVLCLLCALSLSSGCMSHPAGAQPVAMQPSPAVIGTIDEISIERDCSGCPTGSLLVLRRDGTALLSITGKARLGTEGSVAQGTVGRDDFERLARLLLSMGFFSLNDSYEDPQLQDGAWSTTRVLRGTQAKSVFRRDDAGPAALRDFEAAIDMLKARTRFVAAPR